MMNLNLVSLFQDMAIGAWFTMSSTKDILVRARKLDNEWFDVLEKGKLSIEGLAEHCKTFPDAVQYGIQKAQ